MTQADPQLRLRTSTPADEADRAVLVRLADGELDALEDLYLPNAASVSRAICETMGYAA